MSDVDGTAGSSGQAAEQSNGRNGKGHFEKGNSYEYEKGMSGNPSGKTKVSQARIITREIEKWLDKPASFLEITKQAAEKLKLIPEDHTVAEIFGLTMLVHSMRGKGDIIKEVMKRIEGEVPRTLNFGGDPFDDYLTAMQSRTGFEPSAPITNGKNKLKGDNDANA